LPETVARLAGHGNIVGIKEARNEPERMQALLALKSDAFAILSGDDPTAMRAMVAGADGVVSVASNALPSAFRRLCDLALGGNEAEAAALDAQMQDIYDFLGIEPNPIPVKALLAGVDIGTAMRLPLTPLSPEHHGLAARILGAVERIELDCRATLAA
jgi:4-hydroxy-tetrahydrodipicolinate synthase